MEIHEEYITRRKVKSPLIRFVDRANLILKSRKKDGEWGWLHVNILSEGDANHPLKFNFVVSANPTLYTTEDFKHFSNHSKVLKEYKWEWDQYEPGLLIWAKENAGNYVAITSVEAVFVAWEMFVTNYDAWLANFLPNRFQEHVYLSLIEESDRALRINAMKEVEDYMRDKFERVYSQWKNIKGAIEQKNYADWLAQIINDIAA